MREKIIFSTLALIACLLLAHRVWRTAQLDPRGAHAMPLHSATDAEERELFFAAAGAYTQDDIAANGDQPPSQRYRGFVARHDLAPRSGDRLCPITRTKANPACIWTVAGQQYEFCCPPCIDEFVRLAKSNSNQVRPAVEYVQP